MRLGKAGPAWRQTHPVLDNRRYRRAGSGARSGGLMKLGTDTTGAATASLAAQVQQRCGENPARCYQCGKCTAGCPVAFAGYRPRA